jgi:hypothetical protein
VCSCFATLSFIAARFALRIAGFQSESTVTYLWHLSSFDKKARREF